MNTLTMTFLMALLTVVVVTAGKELAGAGGALLAFVAALLIHGISYWFGDRLALLACRADKIAPNEAPWLQSIVQDLTSRAQMPMPRLYWLPRHTTTAFATGRNERHAAVAVTRDMQTLDETRVRTVLTRELSQIKRRDRLFGTIAASVTGAMSVLAHIGE